MRWFKLVQFSWIFIALLCSGQAWSQSVGNYTVGRSTGTSYSSIISTGTSFASWRYTGGFSEDDNRSEATDIGFDFWYNGTRYTQFSVSTNGFIDFSSSTDDGGPQCDDYGYCNTFFSASSNGTWSALAPCYDDMTTGGGVDPLGTSIKYLLTGTAPNRVLTIEWDGMAVYQNTTPDLNFQVKIYESTGVIEYWYETMDNGTKTFSYTIGINAASVSGTPAASELLNQSTANTTTFNNTPTNNLSTMPADNSRLEFTPPAPANPTGSVSFTAITNNSMTLNWTNWASNELGYVVYYSTDDVNYFFQTQTAADATSASIADLLPNTTYYYRVYAVTEGTLSNALIGNATTLSPGTVTSIRNGRWDRTNTWDCACIPTAVDNVIITSTHLVTIRNNDAACNDLTVQGTDGSLRFNRNTATTLDVNGDIIINTGRRIFVNTSSNTTHTINIRGDIINNGSLDLSADANSNVAANFIKTDGNQTISGSGTVNNFYTINIDKSVKNNILEVTSSVFSCDADALNFTSGGTFKFSSTGTNSFSLFSGTKDIPFNGKIWMNSASSTMNFGASVNLRGELLLDAGNIVIGDAENENLISFGGSLEINGGTMEIAGRYDRNDPETTFNYKQTNGTLTLPTIGSTSTTRAPFGLDVSGSSMTMSGGSIIIQREGGSGAQNLGYNTSGLTIANITGGTLQIGDADSPAGQIIEVNSGSSVGNLLLNSANATAELTVNDLSVLNDVTLTLGTLDANNLDITFAGDWLATAGTFVPSSGGLVSLTGANQSVTSNGSPFNDLTLAGTGTKSFQDDLTINGNLIINSNLTFVNSGATLTLGGDFTNNGSFNNIENTLFNGSADQTIGGSTTSYSLNSIEVNKTGGKIIQNADLTLLKVLTMTSATEFDADGAGSGIFTIVSNATYDARIASLATGASISGDVVFEKYFAGTGFKYWRHISSAVIDATIADMQNEIPISGTFTGNDNGLDYGSGVIPVNAFPSLYYYDNASGLVTETLDDRWVVYPNSTNTEVFTTNGNEAQGYAIWVRETGPITFDLTGPVNQGNIDFNPTAANEGWNLIGNPYPSDIDWDVSGWSKTNIQGNAIHVWTGTQYLTWNGTTGSLGNGRIAKGQGFWVQASTTSIGLTATETVKTGTAATTYRVSDVKEPHIIELAVRSNDKEDRAYIQFAGTAGFEFESSDATKLNNSIFNLSTLSKDSVNVSINAVNYNTCSFEIPVMLTNTTTGDYKFDLKVNEDLFDLYKISMMDQYIDQIYPLDAANSTFDFIINQDSASKSPTRFLLNFNEALIKEDLLIEASQECELVNQAKIVLNTSQLGVNYTLWKEGVSFSTITGTGGMLQFDLDSSLLVAGRNQFEIMAESNGCDAQEVVFSTEVEMIETPEVVYDDNNNLLINASGQPGIWYLNGVATSEDPSSHYEPELTMSGAYSVAVSSNNCTLQSLPFLVTAIEEPIEKQPLSIYPNPALDYFKLVSGEPMPNSVTLTITDVNGKQYSHQQVTNFDQRINVNTLNPGIYIVTVEISGVITQLRLIKL